jgi:hypothetical protein
MRLHLPDNSFAESSSRWLTLAPLLVFRSATPYLCQDGRAGIQLAYIDNPNRDEGGLVRCFPFLKASPRHPLVFRGEILLVSDAARVEHALERLQDDAVDKTFGVDYEWFARMEKGVPNGKVDLIQVCSSERLCALFSIAQFGCVLPSPLKDFLCDGSIKKVSMIAWHVCVN